MTIIRFAAAAGAIRPGLQHRFVAGVVLQAIMFNSFAWTIGGRARLGGDPAQGLWDLVLRGVGLPDIGSSEK